LLRSFRDNFHRTRLRGARRPWSLVRRLTGGVALIALLSFGAQALVLWLWLRPVADDLAGIAAEQAVMAQAAWPGHHRSATPGDPRRQRCSGAAQHLHPLSRSAR
jgi:hypothetical protein